MSLPKLRIGDIEAKIPIIQGGMGVGISLSGLASAVAKEGAIGVIAAAEIGMLDKKPTETIQEANKRALREHIEKAKSQVPDGIIGVNIMVALADFDDLLDVSIDAGADLVIMGAGLPLISNKNLAYKLIESKTKIVPIVSSSKASTLIFKYWDKHYKNIPDAVVVEGPLAGGHLGFKREELDKEENKLENIVPKIIESLKPFEDKYSKHIPVIAAGGIFTGEDIYKFINEIGADGVQMATRFVATHECDADEKFKEAYINAKKEDIIIIDSPVGLPGRVVRNKFLDDVAKGLTKPFTCGWQCLKGCDYKKAPYCIAAALANAQRGNLDRGFAFAGVNAYRIDKIVSVKELIQELIEGYKKAEGSAK